MMPHTDAPNPLSDKSTPETILQEDSKRILIRVVTAIARACTMCADGSLKDLNLSTSQAIILGGLFQHNGCRQDDLRSLVKLDKGNVTRALQRLEQNGYIRRQNDPKDRRVTRVTITEKAEQVKQEFFGLAAYWDGMLTAGFSQEERETLISLLLRMEDNVEIITKGNVSSQTNTLE